jgi:hypothetical protein
MISACYILLAYVGLRAGRDDRMVSDWGREARHPFLDESVVQLLRTLPVQFVCDLTLPPGTGDKQLLRLVQCACICMHACVCVCVCVWGA